MTDTDAARIRPLPARVKPLGGETPASFLKRLASANGIEPKTLWSHLRSVDQKLPYALGPDRATKVLEAVAGLPAGWFDKDRRRNLIPRRCEHSHWEYAVCESCCQMGEVKPGCVRCARGAAAQVRSLGGLVCLKHRVWCGGATAIDLSRMPEYLRAEKRLRSVLYARGVSAGSGELQLACLLLQDWAYDQPRPTPIQRREALLPSLSAQELTAYRLDLTVYPEVVELAVILTNHDVAAVLLSPRWDANSQTRVILAAIGQATRQDPPAGVSEVVSRTVHEQTTAVDHAYDLAERHPTLKKRPMRDALIATARTQRACLLRHLDARVLPPPGDYRAGAPIPLDLPESTSGRPYPWLPRPRVDLRHW